MTLHLVNKPPSNPALRSCLASVQAGDAVLLLEGGVYCVGCDVPDGVRMYALSADLRARGFADRLPDRVAAVDDAGFVALACEHKPIVTWS